MMNIFERFQSSVDEAIKYTEGIRASKQGEEKERLNRAERQTIKDSRSEESKAVLYISGIIIVLSMAALGFMDGDYLGAFLFVIPAIVLAYFFYLSKRRVREWDKYESLINYRGNTPLDKLVAIMDKPLLEVCNDLQVMINKGFFRIKGKGLNAYIDHEYNLLVITKNGIPFVEPTEAFKKEKERMEREERAAKAKEEEQKKSGNAFVVAIRDSIDQVADEEMKNILFDMEGYVRRINTQIDRRPELQNNRNVVKLNVYYLPEIIKLIDSYIYINSESMKLKIKDTLQECTVALKKIENEIQEENQDNTDIDIMVLKNTLKREGLLDPDFNISRE